MNQSEIIDTVESVLNSAGFDVSQRCRSRPSCFDVVARRKTQLALIKTHENIGAFSMHDAFELKTLSKHLSAASILVGQKTRHKIMEDDTVYSRYGIYAITSSTLEDIIIRGNNPLVDATPGGYYVRLDSDALRRQRQNLGLSIGKLAEMTGISRRTLYGYEKGIAKASVSVAYNLEYVLGVPLVKDIDVFQHSPEEKEGFLGKAKRLIRLHHCLRSVERKLSRFNIFVAHVKRAPFDFIAKCQKTQLNIIGGVAGNRERNLDRRVEEMLSISKVINAQPVLITEKEQVKNNNITCIGRGELEKINDLDDLLNLL